MAARFPVQVQTTNWMTQVENVDGLDALYFGKVVNCPGTLAVIIKGGGCRFYCQQHKRIYHSTDTCPDCAGKPSPQSPLHASATTCGTP